ncbi:MAG TPA: DUF1573 domain-containing protein [Bacteroidales bacterium]|nr:DUF1573 domain-containing protein [Bacteroidales bacterium]
MKKLLFVILFLGFGTLMAQQPATAPTTNGPEITFAKVVHDFGTIYVGSDGSYDFEFTNTGKEPLILSQPRSSCGCTVPAWPRKPILPGEKESIKVTYNTTIRGNFTKTVTVLSNATTNNAVVLTIRGNVVDKPVENTPVNTGAMGTNPGK